MSKRKLKYVEIIYEEASEAMRKFIHECVDFPLDLTTTSLGFTNLDEGIRYRVYPTRSAAQNPKLREVHRLLDRARGADIPDEVVN